MTTAQQAARNIDRLTNFLIAASRVRVSSTEPRRGLFGLRKRVVRCSNHEPSRWGWRPATTVWANRDKALRKRHGISARQWKKHYRGNPAAQRALAVHA